VNKIIKYPLLQERFETLGYVTLPLLGSAEIKELSQYYVNQTGGGQVQNSPYGMWVSLHDGDDLAFKRQTMDLIRAVSMPRLKEFFVDCKPHLGSYLVKVPNPKSFTFPHQDWTFVDNEKMDDLCSLTVWISLVDVDIESGALGFIKRSPTMFPGVVGSPSPAITTITRGHEPLLFEYLSYQHVKAGDAIAFNNKTIHAAMPNSTNEQRIALGIGMTPTEAVLYHYYLKPGTTDRLLKLRVEDDFFVQYSNQGLFQMYKDGKVPGYCTVEDELPYSFTPLTTAEISEVCEQNGSVRNGRPVDLRR
jgi:hypothetical protein